MVVVKERFGEPGVREQLGEELRVRRVRAQEAQEVEAEEREVEGMLAYALMVPEPKIGKLNLERFPYLIEPCYSDEIADVEFAVSMKATQIGETTAKLRWALRRVDKFGETAMYFFPTDTHVTQFAKERLDPAIAASDYLQRRMSGVNQAHMKQFGGGTLYFRGLESLPGVQSVPADLLVVDEYDECNQKNLEQALRRLSGARAAGRIPRRRYLGRPTLPGFGIAAQFDSSDQRKWLVTCPKCDHEQELSFAENVRWRSEAGGDEVLEPGADEFEQIEDVAEVWRQCSRCGTRLDPTSQDDNASPIHTGRWEATARGPGRFPGYHIPRLIVPFTDLPAIVVASRKTKPHEVETFHWNDLGVPFAQADAQLTDSDLDAAALEGYEPHEEYRGRFPTTMGLDVAGERDLTVRISELGPDGKRRALYLGEPKSFEEAMQLMVRFRCAVAVVDSNPERRYGRTMQRQFPGRVFLASYHSSTDPKVPAWTLKQETLDVVLNRTEAIDAMMDSIRQQRNCPLKREPPKYRDHMKALKRRTEEDTKGRPRRVYVTTGSMGDDYAHAEVYDLMAEELFHTLQLAEQRREAGEHVIRPEEVGLPVRRDPYAYDPGFGE